MSPWGAGGDGGRSRHMHVFLRQVMSAPFRSTWPLRAPSLLGKRTASTSCRLGLSGAAWSAGSRRAGGCETGTSCGRTGCRGAQGGACLCLTWGCFPDSPAHLLGSFSCSQAPLVPQLLQVLTRCHLRLPPQPHFSHRDSPKLLAEPPQEVRPQDGQGCLHEQVNDHVLQRPPSTWTALGTEAFHLHSVCSIDRE